MGSVDAIVADPDDEQSCLALSAFIHALYELDQVMIVRYVKRANAQPLVGFLSPAIGNDVELLYFSQLPFNEDIRYSPLFFSRSDSLLSFVRVS
jgi:ATP-dependent DNA helicase 2 subunit 2